MRAAILGAAGQLGRALTERFAHATPVCRSDLDIADLASVEAFEWSAFDTVLNAAAYTNVDAAETPSGRRHAWRANAIGPRNLAEAAVRHGFTLVHLSSDYVFDGSCADHQEDEAFSPLGAYGQSKAAGDIAVTLAQDHYVLRIAWLVGDGPNFVRTMQRLANVGDRVPVVNDQIGRLTFTDQVADAVEHLLSARPLPGTYNCSNDGRPVSWADVARLVFSECGRSPELIDPISTAAYCHSRPSAAPRPANSTLDLTRIKSTGLVPRDGEAELQAYLQAAHQ